MSSNTAHLTEWTLEQLAEEMLSSNEKAHALSHVEACGRCAAELEAYRSLAVALMGLPRFAPSAAFADAVMSRVQVAPRTSPARARIRRWLPKTRRGWALLAAAVLAPALPVVALVAWLLTNPLVSPATLWQWTSLQVQDGTQTAMSYVLAWGSATGLFGAAEQIFASFTAIPLTTVGVVLGILAVAIPLSAWSLVRLTRTPMGSVTYAN